MKDFRNQKIVKVKCDFCGTEMECPEEMLKTSKKHMCSNCFQNLDSIGNEDLGNVHVDMPIEEVDRIMAGNIADEITNLNFSKIWSREKKELLKMSKKEMSKEVFNAGVYMGVQSMMDLMKKYDEEREEKNQ